MADTLVVIFIALAAAALALQALSMFGIYRTMEGIQREMAEARAEIKQRLDPFAESLTALLADSRESVRMVTANAAEISRTVREQSTRLDNLFREIIDLGRGQLLRLDRTLSGILDKVDTTSAAVERTIAMPLQEVSALVKGVRTGIDFFLSRRRPSPVAEVRHDEEMFI